MRTGTVQYLVGDHLGSTSLTLNNTGGLVAEIRYTAWGESRYTSGTTPTARRYTGQIEESGLGGLYFYNARWYEPGVGRFVQADTVVPGAGNPQALNRYSYSLSNPIRYTDPSGHWVESAVDAAFILYDLWDISQNGLSWESGLSLAADVGGLLLPVVTGGGAAVRAAFHADDAAKVVAHADDALKAFNAADNLGDAGKTVENAVGAYCSFSADTLVATDEGLAPISTIAPGELVLAYHEGLQATGYYTVTASWAHVDPVILEVTLAGETLEVTPDHPFYVVGHGWLTAAELWPGAEIVRAEGEAGAVESLRALAQPQAMYNLTVAEAHTYFVGAQQWLVHNACPIENPVRPYEVGLVNDLKARSPGYGLDIHHAPQSNPASQVIPGYNPKTAPGIALPEAVHDSLNRTNLNGPYAGSPRDLLAKTIGDLRTVNVPNSALQQLVDLNRRVYPGVFAK